MAAPPYMRLYVADYTADVQHLSCEQDGAYWRLLRAMWRGGGRLQNDPRKLSTIVGLSEKRWLEIADDVVLLFHSAGGTLTHKRMLRELEHYADISAKRGATGGAQARWGTDAVGGTRSERLTAARAIATHTEEEWAAMLEVTGNQCVKCRTPASDLYGEKPCKDHVQPVYLGGSDGILNLQPLCRQCNSGKGKRPVDYRESASPGWFERLQKRLPNASMKPPKPESEPKPDSHPSGESHAPLVEVDELQRQSQEAMEAAGEALASMATHPGVAMIAPLRALMAGENPCDWTADIIPAIHSAAAWHMGKGGAGSMKTWTAVARFATENRDQRLAGPGTGKTNGSTASHERIDNLARAYASTGERPKLHR